MFELVTGRPIVRLGPDNLCSNAGPYWGYNSPRQLFHENRAVRSDSVAFGKDRPDKFVFHYQMYGVNMCEPHLASKIVSWQFVFLDWTSQGSSSWD